jgi:multicomponent Na+:H+ antiporter subunit B
MTPETAVLYALLGFTLATAVVTALARTLLTAIVAFGAYSLGLAMVWVVLRAPDVGLTEAAVGAGVTTGLFLLVARRATPPRGSPVVGSSTSPATAVERPSESDSSTIDLRAAAVAGVVTAGLLLTVPALPGVGAADAPAFGPVTEFYLTDAADRGIDNAVTAVLVVYRGFDTFGEIAVVFTAAVAVLAVLGREVLV